MTAFRCPSDILFTSCWLFTMHWSRWPRNHLVPCVAELVGFMPVRVFLIQSASLIHLVCRCASQATTSALSQSTTWFSSTAWSVMTDLWVILALEARDCVPAVKGFLGHLLRRVVNSQQDVNKMSEGHRNVVIRQLFNRLCRIRISTWFETNWMTLFETTM